MKNTIKQKQIVLFLVLAAYLLFNLVLALYHEPWRDEAQVWLLARDIPFWKLPAQMGYEGHPCLWHWIIYPFVHLGFPYFVQNVIAYVFMALAAVLFLWKSDFSMGMKILIILCPVMTYQYPVIARSYCLIPIIMFLLAMWYPDRMEHPVRYAIGLAFLVQTHVILIVTAFLLCLCFMIEMIIAYIKEKNLKHFLCQMSTLLIPFCSALFLLLEMTNVKKSSLLKIRTPGFARMLAQILEKEISSMNIVLGLQGKACYLILAVSGLLVLAALLRRKGTNATVMTVVLGTFAFQSWFSAMVYGLALQKLLTFVVVLIWGMWIYASEEKKNRNNELNETPERTVKIHRVVFAVVCLIAIWHSISSIKLEITDPYSNGRQTAQFIKENLPADAVYMTDNQAECTAIFPYLEKKNFLYAPNGMEFTYVTWDEHWNEKVSYDGFQTWLSTLDTGGKPVYLISCFERSGIEDNSRMDEQYQLVYQSPLASIKGEDYKIFKIR